VGQTLRDSQNACKARCSKRQLWLGFSTYSKKLIESTSCCCSANPREAPRDVQRQSTIAHHQRRPLRRANDLPPCRSCPVYCGALVAYTRPRAATAHTLLQRYAVAHVKHSGQTLRETLPPFFSPLKNIFQKRLLPRPAIRPRSSQTQGKAAARTVHVVTSGAVATGSRPCPICARIGGVWA
jgi:hypothetical protein